MNKAKSKPALTLSAEQLKSFKQQIGALYQTAWFIESAINTVLAETIGEGADTDGLSVYAETLLRFIKDCSSQQMNAIEAIQEATCGTVMAHEYANRLALKIVDEQTWEGRSHE
jgi:hypothetical protein